MISIAGQHYEANAHMTDDGGVRVVGFAGRIDQANLLAVRDRRVPVTVAHHGPHRYAMSSLTFKRCCAHDVVSFEATFQRVEVRG